MIGEYSSRVTSGNRIAVPKQFRSILGKDLIVTKGFEKHLVLVNQVQFTDITAGVVDQPFIVGEVRDVTRYLLGNAYTIEPDSQGRFVVPEKLHEHAGIEKEVVFIGLGRWVEIWDKDVWEKHSEALSEHSVEIANRLVAGTSATSEG